MKRRSTRQLEVIAHVDGKSLHLHAPLDLRECQPVYALATIRALDEIGAPRQALFIGGRLAWYARKEDVRAATVLLRLTQDGDGESGEPDEPDFADEGP